MKNDLPIKDASLAEMHEDAIFQKISVATGDIVKSFGKYGCKLEIIRKWHNSQDSITSDTRLPIKFGYECWICCDVIRNGITLKVPSNDGEVDYYVCSACFTASLVTKSFFRPKLIMNSDFSETLDELRNFLEALHEGKV